MLIGSEIKGVLALIFPDVTMKMSVGTKLSRFCNILSKFRSSIPPHRYFIVPSATKFKTFEPDYLDVRAANRNLIFFSFS